MIIDDFNGFLKFGKETFPFSFSKNKITIHPTTIDKWKELYIEWFNKDFNEKRKKWLDKIIIDGITDRHKGVKFLVTDNPRYFNGYYTYSVDFMYIYDINPETNDMYDVKGIRFKGPEINYFYNVSDYITSDLETKNNSFDRFYLELKSKKDKDFGNFRWHNYSVSIKGSFSWKKENDTYGPLEINSLLVLELSRTCNDLKKLIELIDLFGKVIEQNSQNMISLIQEYKSGDDNDVYINSTYRNNSRYAYNYNF